MRIAEIAPPWLTVPPRAYGGTEQVVAHLAEGLTARGHDVTLFASGGSRVGCRLVSPLDQPPPPVALGNVWDESYHTVQAYLQADEFDLIHDHSGAVGTTIAALRPGGPPVVHTMHNAWLPETRRHYSVVGPRLHLVAVSAAQRDENGSLAATVIHHGLDLANFPFGPSKDDVLAFLGRSSPDKGPVEAIEIARRSGLPLIMMIKAGQPEEREYWRTAVAPRLGQDVEVILDADHDTKTAILTRSRALLFPIRWNEPFGLVMIEAMACGTPVVATRRGSTPEIIVDGKTGFLVAPNEVVAGSVRAVERLDEIDAQACRHHVARDFTVDRMVNTYDMLFRRLVPSRLQQNTPALRRSFDLAHHNGPAPDGRRR